MTWVADLLNHLNHHLNHRLRRLLRLAVLASSLLWLPMAVSAATFVVTVVGTRPDVDEVDLVQGDGACATIGGNCTLRAAIQEANVLPGADTIQILAGDIRLNPGIPDDDASAVGDLDITDDVSIHGSTVGPTVIIGRPFNRVFDIIGPGIVHLTRLTIRDGSLRGGEDGGGIHNDAALTLSSVTLSNNETTLGNGGGIANFNGGTVAMSDCTVSGNRAPARSGGGIANFAGSTVELINVTIANNSAQSGGGLHSLGTSRARNSLFAGNATGGNCAGIPPLSDGHNLDDNTLCVFSSPGDISNGAALLKPLSAEYGGFIPTHEPMVGSAAIDAGDNEVCPAKDQRGYPRPIDFDLNGTATCDIGAVEVQPIGTPTSTPTRTPTMPTATITSTPSITATPSQTATITRTETPSVTPTRSATSTFTPTSTRTGTLPPTPTSTPTRTPTRTATATRSGTPSRTTTRTRTPTPSPTGQATASPTRSATVTATGAITPTPDMTTSPGSTKVPTPTVDPSTPTTTRTPSATPLRPTLNLGSPRGLAGASTQLSAVLGTAGASVAAVQVDLTYPSSVSVGAVSGRPDCQMNPGLDRFSFFSFVGGGTLRAVIFTIDDPITGIPDGSLLFSCRLDIASGTQPGEYDLLADRLSVSDVDGLPLIGAQVVGGGVTVDPPPTATVTPTETATGTPTESPTSTASISPTETVTPTPRPCAGDCNGGGAVSFDEIVALVEGALSGAPTSSCPMGDTDQSNAITIDEVVQAVNSGTTGCPS